MMHKYTNDRLCVFYTCVSINSVIKWTSKGVVTMASMLWPDFSEKDIDEAVAEYRRRDRRFGGVKA